MLPRIRAMPKAPSPVMRSCNGTAPNTLAKAGLRAHSSPARWAVVPLWATGYRV